MTERNPSSSIRSRQAYTSSGVLPGSIAALAIDPSGNAYLTGYTTSAQTPAINAFGPQPDGSSLSVLKLSSDLKNYLYSTFINGSNHEGMNGPTAGSYARGTSIDVDRSGRVYVGGVTNAFDFPTTNGSKDPYPGAEFYIAIALVLDP